MTDLIKEVLRGWDVYGPHSITLEHTLFRIHTQFTAGALFVAGIFIGASQYFGKPISCQLEGVDEEFINAHCWARGIVILRNKRQFDAFEYAPHFGILDYDPRIHEKVFYKNYCHIPWMFVASSAMFALPGLVWHAKKVNWLVKLLQQYSDPCQEDKELEKRLSSLSKVYHNLNPFFGRLAKRFIFCEICVFCNVICHLVLSIVLLKSTFGRYHIGLLEALLSDSKLDRLEYPWDLVFPKYGICQFRNYGPSGDIQTYKPLCMLSQNFATEKIAKPLIVWFLVLTIITLISMVYRVVLISFQGARLTSLMGLAGLSNVNKNLHMVCFSGNYGHWYLLNILSNNIDALTFQDFVSHLAATHAQRPSAP